MNIRNRNKEIRKIRVGDLRTNPVNHRTHSDQQKAALSGILEEVGFCGTLLGFELPDETIRLLDGHARIEILDPDDEVEVSIVDLDPEERRKVLATHDAIGAMAGIDHAKLDALIEGISFDSPAIINMLADLPGKIAEMNQEGDESSLDESPGDSQGTSKEIPESWQVVASCQSEDQQREVYELLTAEGIECRLLSL